jgi:hypothetical protein
MQPSDYVAGGMLAGCLLTLALFFVFGRLAGAPAPPRVVRLECPSCGNLPLSVALAAGGRCPVCLYSLDESRHAFDPGAADTATWSPSDPTR